MLRELAAAISELIRRECCFARYGGEEFAIVLPETDMEDARVAAERIRATVKAKEFNVEGRRLSVTISAGVAVMDDDIGGIAVHIAARIMSLAADGEILVSSAIPPLVLGSGIDFSDRGTHELKGVDEEICSVVTDFVDGLRG